MESSIERGLVRWCNQQGFLCLKLAGPIGFPDRCIITDTKVIFIELKQKSGRLSPHQIHWIKKIACVGGAEASVAYSLDEAKQLCLK